MFEGLLLFGGIVAVVTIAVFELLKRYARRLSARVGAFAAGLFVPALIILAWFYDTYSIFWSAHCDQNSACDSESWQALTKDAALIGSVSLLAGLIAAFAWAALRARHSK